MTISTQAGESATFRGRWLLACGAFYAVVVSAYFARGLWRGDLIASEDAVNQFNPQFSYPYHAWTRLLFCGYPLFADPQNMSFLPLRVLLSALGEWNVFVLSAYVLAACWACLYAYEVTGDRLGALAALAGRSADRRGGARVHVLRGF
jgi:hypothetical protein